MLSTLNCSLCWNDCCSFVSSGNFTIKAHNSLTPKIQIHRLTKIMPSLLCRESEAIPSKQCRHGYSGWSVHMGKFSSRLPSEISVTGSACRPHSILSFIKISMHRNFYEGENGGGDISETEPARLTELIWRGPYSRFSMKEYVERKEYNINYGDQYFITYYVWISVW